MTPGLTSIIIPTYNHARYLPDAVDSALAQTAEVEVIVVDDGSTDGTAQMMERRRDLRVRMFRVEHSGPAAARNAGIEAAMGEFVMFLDADDVIAPNKIATQLWEMFDANVGWVLCDVRIEDTDGKVETASARYNYAAKDLNGWLQPLLVARNFIPIMSPLIRSAALGDIRFHPEDMPEDWHFWHAIAGTSRSRYVPQVLATYRKRPGSRNTASKTHPTKRPGVVAPLRLNLGCGTPDTRSWHPMPGHVNLDRSLGWRFEDGLGDFADGSVAGITVSHALMYVAPSAWPRVFAEFARVLKPGGVMRVTEDDTEHPESSRVGGWKGSEPAVAQTSPRILRHAMESVGFTVHDIGSDNSIYPDASLCQAQHGAPPDVFWIEGVRECAVLFEPHADDGALFCSFQAIRHRPRVVTCCPSSGDYGDTGVRHAETIAAMAVLGAGPCEQWDGQDLERKMRELDARLRPTRVFAPSADSSHQEHVAVAVAAFNVFGDRLTRYQTYNAAGKVRDGDLVPFDAEWLDLKRRALACYKTQLAHPRAHQFFELDYAEYQE